MAEVEIKSLKILQPSYYISWIVDNRMCLPLGLSLEFSVENSYRKSKDFFQENV